MASLVMMLLALFVCAPAGPAEAAAAARPKPHPAAPPDLSSPPTARPVGQLGLVPSSDIVQNTGRGGRVASTTRPTRSPRPSSGALSPKRNEPFGRSGWGLSLYTGSMGGVSMLGVLSVIPLGTPTLSLRVGFCTLFSIIKDKEYMVMLVSLELAVRSWIRRDLLRLYAGPRFDVFPLGVRSAKEISDLPVVGFGAFAGAEWFLLKSLSFFVEGGFDCGMLFGFSRIKYPGEAFGFLAKIGVYWYF